MGYCEPVGLDSIVIPNMDRDILPQGHIHRGPGKSVMLAVVVPCLCYYDCEMGGAAHVSGRRSTRPESKDMKHIHWNENSRPNYSDPYESKDQSLVWDSEAFP